MPIILLFFISGFIFPNVLEVEAVVGDKDFEYREVSDSEIRAFLSEYSNCPFRDYHVSFINKVCKRFNVSVVWALARAQTEQGIVINFNPHNTGLRMSRCMAYSLWSKDPPVGFENQVFMAIKCMRDWADEWRPGSKTYVQGFGMVECKNSATYSLHKYNPIWGAASNYGVYNIGNELFIQVLKQFKARWPIAQNLASQN